MEGGLKDNIGDADGDVILESFVWNEYMVDFILREMRKCCSVWIREWHDPIYIFDLSHQFFPTGTLQEQAYVLIISITHHWLEISEIICLISAYPPLKRLTVCSVREGLWHYSQLLSPQGTVGREAAYIEWMQ